MERMLGPIEVCELLGVTRQCLYRWTSASYVPHRKVGRFLRFYESELVQWLNERKVHGGALRTGKAGAK